MYKLLYVYNLCFIYTKDYLKLFFEVRWHIQKSLTAAFLKTAGRDVGRLEGSIWILFASKKDTFVEKNTPFRFN